ncbi:MAG: ATP-dependent helicase, partial [Scytonema sp. CRU_2_7]|nr:ATP-dependent helicase [Scytonema sp. CRU_2_7]
AEHEIVQIKVKLSQHEREKYNQLIQTRNDFLRESRISLGSIQGWQMFVQMSARSQNGRRAMLAHREAKEIALGTDGKLRILANLLAKHYPERMIIFTADNATVYRISQEMLIPAITHQTPVKERHEILTKFREGEYNTLIASHVLNEGVDVPAASIAIILSGTGSTREYIQRLGRVLRKGNIANKQAILYEVVAEDTSEERTSARRRGETALREGFPTQATAFPEGVLEAYPKGVEKSNEPQRRVGEASRREGHEGKKEKRGHLQVVYGTGKQRSAKAAEQLEINYSTKRNEDSPDLT